MPTIHLQVAGSTWRVDTVAAAELAIPLDFHGDQPRAFSMPAAGADAVVGDGFVGDTRQGGSVNCETVELIPHGNGTHTEGVGHITEQRVAVGDTAAEPLIPATLLTVTTRRLGDVDESYAGENDPDDRVICAADLQRAHSRADVDEAFLAAVVIRTADIDTGPGTDFSGTNPPYLTAQAVCWLRDVGCEHVLVELPSIDREHDGGIVPNHYRFFGVEPGEEPGDESRRRTITEMIRVPDDVDDGAYVLSLRFPRFVLDAAPSRPVLYPIVSE